MASYPRLLIIFPRYKFCEEIDSIPEVTLGDIVNSVVKANANILGNLGAFVLYHGDTSLDPNKNIVNNGIKRNTFIIVKSLRDIQEYA